MLKDDFIAPSINVETLDPALKPEEIATKPVENAGLDSVMTNSFGFGGTNGSMLLSRYNDWGSDDDGSDEGKRGLVMGVANERSIAWGIAKALHARARSWPSPTRARRSASAWSRWRPRRLRRSWSTWT
jgi:hypothetical protein